MSLATEYAAYIRESRRAQLAHDAQAIGDLEQLLTDIAAKQRQAVRDTPKGILGARFQRDLTASLDKTLDEFRDRYKALLDPAIVESARIAEDRERRLVDALRTSDEVPAPLQLALHFDPANAIDRAFGQVPQLVLERAYQRTYADGLKLSDRLYNLDRDARKAAANAVTEALATGKSARQLSKELQGTLTRNLTEPGVGNLRFKAMRIARTEINSAYREGHIASVTDPDTGELKPWVDAIGWRLSPAHPRVDICDAWAGDDTEELGDGNYSPENVPTGHPLCLCYTITLLAILPNERFESTRPQPEKVPQSQRAYYAAKASRMVAKQ